MTLEEKIYEYRKESAKKISDEDIKIMQKAVEDLVKTGIE